MKSDIITVSEQLTSARQDQGLSIKEVAEDICINSNYLTAIEAANYGMLPGYTFAVGFVKSYASVLGLDPDEIGAQFKAEYGPVTKSGLTVPAVHTVKPKRHMPVWLSPVIGLIGVGACWMVLGGSFSLTFLNVNAHDVATEEAQLAAVQANLNANASTKALKILDVSPKVETPATETIEENLVLPVVATPVDTPSVDMQNITVSGVDEASVPEPKTFASIDADSHFQLAALEDSWVLFKHPDGTDVWSGILQEGDIYRPDSDKPVLLSTSNAGGVMLQVGSGEPMPLGERGAIISDVKLEDTQLLTGLSNSNIAMSGSR